MQICKVVMYTCLSQSLYLSTADEDAGPSETVEIHDDDDDDDDNDDDDDDDDDDFEAPVPKKPKAVEPKAQKEPRQAAKRSCKR